MSLETSLKECGAALVSARATERKKNAEMLKEFLTRNAVPSVLSANTIKKQGYTWNDLFDDVNEFVLKETEKFESSKNFDTVIGPLCANLLYLCVAGSNKGKAHIKCDKVIDACMLVLKDNHLKKAIGDAYLNLLYKYVLTCDHYLNLITPTGWEDLLNVCLSTCLSKQGKLDNFTKMRLLVLVIRNAKNCCQFVVPLRNSLPKLKKCFQNFSDDKKVQEILIEITILLLEMLSSECRLTMCEFTEEILSSILKFYEQNLEIKKKTSLFKLLHLSVILHHPQGRMQNELGSLSANWLVWKKQMNNFLELICLEVPTLQKLRKQDEHLLKYYGDFFSFAATVYCQIFNIAEVEEIGENSSKRQRVTFNKNKCFNDLLEELKQNHVPWLGITHVFVKKFGTTISADDFATLLAIIETLISNNVNLNWDSLEETTCLAVERLMCRVENEVLSALWNTCVRNSTLISSGHRSSHTIIQSILSLDVLTYKNVEPLTKLYYEKSLPLTDCSVKTLNCIIYKFFNKCSSIDDRLKLLSWLIEGQITSLDVLNLKELLLRLLSSETVHGFGDHKKKKHTESIREMLFDSIEKSILFSEFELAVSSPPIDKGQPPPTYVDFVADINREVKDWLLSRLSDYISQMKRKENLLESIKFLNIVIAYFDLLLNYNFAKREEIVFEEMYCLFKGGLRVMYTALIYNLKTPTTPNRVELLECAQNIFVADCDPLLSSEVRRCVNEDFFQCINNIMNKDIAADDDTLYEEDEVDPNALKHNCITLLAAYCTKREQYRNEILDLILDPKIYNFTFSWDFNCAINCIKLLKDANVEDPPLELIFILMQNMCKDLFRNSQASYKILVILEGMLDQIWSGETEMRQNCHIMVKSYMQRCEKLYYPPQVAALVYACAVKIAVLNLSQGQNRNTDNTYVEILLDKIKGDNHDIRLYCCYLLELLVDYMSECDIESFLSGLAEIFVIKVSERIEAVLKDESTNRTLTVLHCFYMLAQAKRSLLQNIVTEVMQLQKEKSLDTNLVRKVLNKITTIVSDKSIESYINDNMLAILNFWFANGNEFEDLPLVLMGFESTDSLIEKHMKWLVPAEILWRKKGNVKDSEVLKRITNRTKESFDSVIENCICNMIVLPMPYVVIGQYKLSYCTPGKTEWASYADKMFNSTRSILGMEKWSNLFVENMSEIVILMASHLNDHLAAKQIYHVDVPNQRKSYHFPKEVFEGVLKYIEELIEEDTMRYLCGNQPLAIFMTLIKLWEKVIKESIFEVRILLLHNFMTFLECIPLGHQSDAFVCNFACTSLAHAIKSSQNKEEIRALVRALKTVLEKFLVKNSEIVRKPVSEILTVLMVKTDEGFSSQCADLLKYLVEDMKDYLKQNEDVIDFVSSMSQRSVENVKCATIMEFMQRLRIFINNLTCPSHETLLKLYQFLKENQGYVLKLSEELNNKGFSDDCGKSSIHQIIHALSNVLKSATDDKTKIEACNCLVAIGNYDLKTLVTVPPTDTRRIGNFDPRRYLAMIVMSSLCKVLFDEKPTVSNAVVKSLKRLLQYREGETALELEEKDKDILMPFSTPQCTTFADFKINDARFNFLRRSEHWFLKPDEKHTQWLTRITVAILDVLASQANYLTMLRAVCLMKPNVCRKILSPLMGILLECSSEQHVKILSELVNQFFRHIWDMNFESAENSENSLCRRSLNTLDQNHKMVVQYMLEVVDFVRLQRCHYKPRPDRTFETLNYLRLEYDKVAWAASVANQNLSAIYYAELWTIAQNSGVPPSSPETTTQLTGGEDVQSILRNCYVSISELDAIDGCGTSHLANEDEKRKHLINIGRFADALLLHDIALSCGGPVDPHLQYGVVKSLHKSGMHHLALQYIKSLPETEDLNDIKYECLSFLGDWSDFVHTRDLEKSLKQTNSNSNSVIKAYRYTCLKDCLNLQMGPSFESKLVQPLNQAKLAVARLCQNLNMENCQNIYKVLNKLQLFNDIEEYFSVRNNTRTVKEMVKKWQVEKLPAFNDFKHLEALISQRSLILEHASKTYQRSLKDIVSLQLQYAELGLSNQRIQMAQRILAVTKKALNSLNVSLTESRISWAKGYKDFAISLLRNIITDPSPGVKLAAMSLRQYGLWMAESKCENPRDIINKYLKKSLEVLSQNVHEETRLKVYHDIAKFADAEYKQVVSYLNSSLFEEKQKVLQNMKDAASTLSLQKTQHNLNKDERKASAAYQKFGDIEEEEIRSIREEKENYLHLAMRYYLLSLRQSEDNNLSVFRVISLWLDNPAVQLADCEDGSFENLIHSIPSRKYVTVLPQLAPRLTNESSMFADNLKKIIRRCAEDHPHHTLPILFSLKNSDKDKQILNESEKGGGSTQAKSQKAVEPRVSAAGALIRELGRETGLAAVIAQMDRMCDAIISFANYAPKSKDPTQKQKISNTELIHRLGHLDAIPIPTVTIPVRHDSLVSFENYFETVGGINCPKKINCKGSDGRSRILLIKGEDDLRQDAVMQQVFNIVNTMIENDPVTSRNKLLIRTYKVVPMSRKSGVLEWCEGTMPIGSYLLGTAGAHARYRPQDISALVARQKLQILYDKRRPNQEKLTVFLRILKEFRPVFHYFFTEHFLDPVTWYERRLAYTKSVAASSMVGYILGLGDRHLQNILIDKRTAEVVHIDFGIAFDQGKILPTPETVPFRLTQDIVAGFGCSAVEGIFRRNCEKTMQLLRDNQDTLLTILEVLLCDPLYSWSITCTQQNVSNQVLNSDSSLAKRALLTVSSKLSGTEGGAAGGVAVPGQVARLIQTAMDPINLSRLYHGWQPFL